jgi:hypothetical protein
LPLDLLFELMEGLKRHGQITHTTKRGLF